MKNLLYIFIFLLPFVSCVSKKNADKIQSEKDSLAVVLAAKDSMINDVFASLNDITLNLNTIKERENIITSSVENGEIKKQSSAQISEDISAIDQLLQSNRETIARLQQSAAQLRRANIKIASLDKLIKEMSVQVQAKDNEIVSLKADLKRLNVQVADLSTKVMGLNTQVETLNQDNSKLEGEVKSKGDLLNTAYYIVGAQKELLSSEIVYKSGFIGRTLKINESRSLDSFTQVDIRTFDEVIIGKKNVTLVSSHPAGSYEFVMNGKEVFSSLVITDKDKFWEYSKVLVISYK